MPKKSHWVASMLALSGTGFTGIDRFYLGYVIFGIIKACTFGGAGVWTLIDAIFITHCWLKDANGQVLEGCKESDSMTLGEAVEKAGDDTKKAADDAAAF